MKTRFLLLGTALLIFAGCSDRTDQTYTSPTSPAATPVLTPTVAPAVTPVTSPVASPTPLPTGSPLADVQTRLRELETQMDSVFADTFRNVANWFGPSRLGSSVDLREQSDKYIARVYLPEDEKAKVDAKVENGALRLSGESERTTDGKVVTERFERIMALEKPDQADKNKVEKKDDVVVVTVPKTSASEPAVAAASPTPAADAAAASPAETRDTMLEHFARMQDRLNRTIREVFGSDLAAGASNTQVAAATKVDEQKDEYVVHFSLPDRDLSKVNVKFENGFLHLTAEEQKKASTETAAGAAQNTYASARYEEMITLPGPVKDAEMKVERQGGSVIVTLPKA